MSPAEAPGTGRRPSRRALLAGAAGTAVVAAGAGIGIPLLVRDREEAAPQATASSSAAGNLVLQEDFSGDALDSSVWTVRNDTAYARDWGWVQASNVTVQDHTLRLAAHRMATARTTADGRKRTWSSADVTTAHKMAIEYGRWEFRTLLPVNSQDLGFWTGVWLRPEDSAVGGEIDVVEGYGGASPQRKSTLDPTGRAQSTVHLDQTGHHKVAAWSPAQFSLGQDWSHWAMERTTAGVRIWCNDVQVLHVPATRSGYATAFPTGTRLHLRISFQVGNAYWGQPTSASPDGAMLQVRDLTVREYPNGTATDAPTASPTSSPAGEPTGV